MKQKQNSQNLYSIHRTDKWSWEKIKRYKGEINDAMKKYAQRFPDDVCLETMANEIATGQTQLWIVLKNKKKFSAFVTTKIEVTRTGKKRVVILDLAGEGGVNLVKLIDDVEEWARKINAKEIVAFGRYGWAKRIAHHGYSLNLIHYRKVLEP
ncbi:hypothetical protein [Bartonella sp. CB189]|uniref:hypothetical protein n=1 Tax=Bartonella sp. CB189 TaxID=3112254 RepID=UPI002F96A87F